MLRKILCALAVLALSFGIATAEQLKGRITKMADGKVTFQEYNKKEKVGDPKTFDVAKDCTVSTMVKKNKEAVAAGLKAEQLQNIDATKGIGATIDVTNGKVTEIIVGGGKKKN